MSSRSQVLEWINEVFRSYQFNRLSSAEKDEYLDMAIADPLLATYQISRNDLIEMLSQVVQASETFNQLGRDPLYLILTRTNPKDVGNLCQVTPSLGRLCRDENVFLRLLQLHYPDVPINVLDPKTQYLAIAANVRTYYYVYINELAARDGIDRPGGKETGFTSLILYGPPNQLQPPLVIPPSTGEPVISRTMENYSSADRAVQVSKGLIAGSTKFVGAKAEEDIPKTQWTHPLDSSDFLDLSASYGFRAFYIHGTPLPTGTRVWVAYSSEGASFYFYCSKTKEGITRFMLHGYPAYLKKLGREYMDYIHQKLQLRDAEGRNGERQEALDEYNRIRFRRDYDVVNSPLFIKYLRELWSGEDLELAEMIPFTRRNFAAFIAKHNYYRVLGNRDMTDQWIFFRMEF